MCGSTLSSLAADENAQHEWTHVHAHTTDTAHHLRIVLQSCSHYHSCFRVLQRVILALIITRIIICMTLLDYSYSIFYAYTQALPKP